MPRTKHFVEPHYTYCDRCGLTFRYDPPTRCIVCRKRTEQVAAPLHGEEPSANAYKNHGCRCDACTALYRTQHHLYRLSRRELQQAS